VPGVGGIPAAAGWMLQRPCDVERHGDRLGALGCGEQRPPGCGDVLKGLLAQAAPLGVLDPAERTQGVARVPLARYPHDRWVRRNPHSTGSFSLHN
jgi:hypothetical protein